MTFSGALHELRANPGAYADYVKKSIENVTFAADEIERDLHRALPEVSFHPRLLSIVDIVLKSALGKVVTVFSF